MRIVGNANADAYWCYDVPMGRVKPEASDPMVREGFCVCQLAATRGWHTRGGARATQTPLPAHNSVRHITTGRAFCSAQALIEDWVRSKYERKWFLKKDTGAPITHA